MYTKRALGTAVGALALTAGLLGPYAHPTAAQPAAKTRATAAQYSLQRISSPNDPTFTQLLGINDQGRIAGYFGSGQTVNGDLHRNQGFTLRLPSSFKAENVPHAAQTQVIAINNHGDTAGFYIDHQGTTHGFLESAGRFQRADRQGTPFNQILGLNDHGQAVGYDQDAQGHDHAYIRDRHGRFTLLPLTDSQATGINDAGTVVGFTQPSAATSAGFILKGGLLSLLIYPGSAFTQALGENTSGQVVGFYHDGAGNSHGFIYDTHARTFQTVDVLGASSTTLNGINNAGQVVGFFTDANGNTVGLVGTPGSGQTGTTSTATATPTASPSASPTATPTATSTMTSTQTMSSTIKIGLLLPFSGTNAAQGLSAEQGAQLAVNQANAANLVPGVNFVLSARDDPGSANAPGSDANLQALTNDPEVAGIIGPFDTTTGRVELPLANKLDVALVSPSAGDPCLTSSDVAAGCIGSPFTLASVRPTTNLTFFRIIPTDPKQGMALADYLYKVRHFLTAYVVDDTGAYGIGVANAFSSEWQLNGGVVVGRTSVPEGTASFINLLTHIAVARPDVIFFGGSDPASGSPDSIAIRRQMLQVPSLKDTAFAGGDGIDTPQFAQAVGAFGGPVWSTLTPADPAGVPGASAFVAQYQAAFGAPGRYSASGDDSANVLLTAIAAAFKKGAQTPSGPGAATEATALRQMVVANVASTSLVGVTNPVSFSPTGDLTEGLISIEQLGNVNGAPGWQPAAIQKVR